MSDIVPGAGAPSAKVARRHAHAWLKAARYMPFVFALLAVAHPHAQAIHRFMYVSVLDQAGAPVPDLGPSDFIVREDNVAREVLKVEPATDPMHIALLIDNSAAARSTIPDLRKALHEFVAAVTGASDAHGRNDLALTTLADRPTIVSDYTTNAAALDKAIDRIFAQPQSGMLLLQGIIDVCKGFKAQEAQRPIVLAIVTNGPELSDRFHDHVLDPLRDSGAAFHAIVVGHDTTGMDTNSRERGIVLDEGTRDTGGRRDNVLTSMALSMKLAQVATELTHQYKITYARPQSLIPPEHVTVAATRAGLTARGTLIKEPKR
jgi:hypothetical protein